MVQPIIKIHSNRGLLVFSGFFGKNFSRRTFLKFYFSYVSIHINSYLICLWKMTRYISLNFLYAQKSFKYVAEALTPLLRLGTFSWIMTLDSHQINFSIPNLGRGPPGRGPQLTG